MPATAVNEELRDELLAMMAEDQAVRTGVAPPGDDRTPEELAAAWDSVDAANARRMYDVLDEFGWPGWSLVGEDGALAAWVLIQHADLHLDLQKRGLALLEAAVAADDASPGDLAYLVDRVRVAEGLPQVYGTQVGAPDEDGNPTPRTPIEDPENVSRGAGSTCAGRRPGSARSRSTTRRCGACWRRNPRPLLAAGVQRNLRRLHTGVG